MAELEKLLCTDSKVESLKKINAIIENGGDDGLDGRITNCLLEVPQRIKLELADGVLTLKAGSVVIVPNGFEEDGTTPKFDYVTVESDTNISPTGGSGACLICINVTPTGAGFGAASIVGNCISGNGVTPINYGMCYDTAENIVQRWGNGVVTMELASLPLALITQTDNTITSIRQVFNGMGYIGSTVWVDKGVKGLIPDGRNEDGTLRNIEWTTQNIILRNNTEKGSCYLAILNNGTRVSIADKQNWNFDEKSNRILDDGVIRDNIGFYGDITLATGGVITSFNPKQPFRAVDQQDVIEKTTNKTLTLTGMSDGYCQQRFVNGDYGMMFRQDGDSFYTLLTNKGDPYGNWNDLRPFSINLATGEFSFTKSSKPATTTSSANAGKPAVIIYNYRNGESWIRKWSDGWIEQGGFIARSGTTTTISLLTAHSNASFNVQVTMAAGAGNRYAASIVNRATNSFQVYCTHTEPIYFWRTCGY